MDTWHFFETEASWSTIHIYWITYLIFNLDHALHVLVRTPSSESNFPSDNQRLSSGSNELKFSHDQQSDFDSSFTGPRFGKCKPKHKATSDLSRRENELMETLPNCSARADMILNLRRGSTQAMTDEVFF